MSHPLEEKKLKKEDVDKNIEIKTDSEIKEPVQAEMKEGKDEEDIGEGMEVKPKVDFHFDNPYSYEFLLDRINDIIKRNNTYSTLSKDFVLKPITIERAAKQKFYWTKFKEFCQSLNRSPEHFSAFLSAELGINTLLADEKLVMEGRKIETKKVEDITKKYINEYIKCQICKSTNTTMDKNRNSRMLEMICQKCQSKRTVLPIKSTLAAINRK